MTLCLVKLVDGLCTFVEYLLERHIVDLLCDNGEHSGDDFVLVFVQLLPVDEVSATMQSKFLHQVPLAKFGPTFAPLLVLDLLHRFLEVTDFDLSPHPVVLVGHGFASELKLGAAI